MKRLACFARAATTGPAGYRVSMPSGPLFAVIPRVVLQDGEASIPGPPGSQAEASGPSQVSADAAARYWMGQGATRLHVVDRDAGAERPLPNARAVGRIVEATAGRVQVDLEASILDPEGLAAAAATHAGRVVIDCAALADVAFLDIAVGRLRDRLSLAIALDERGRVVAPGTPSDGLDIWAELPRLTQAGVSHFTVSERGQSGHWWHRHGGCLEEFCRRAGVPVTDATGVRTLERLHRLCDLAPLGLDGAIVGDAVADGDFTFAEAQAAAEARFDPYEWGPARP